MGFKAVGKIRNNLAGDAHLVIFSRVNRKPAHNNGRGPLP